VSVVVDGADVGGGAELDCGGVPEDVVVAADEAAESFGQRVDDGFAGDAGRQDDQRLAENLIRPGRSSYRVTALVTLLFTALVTVTST
jgi:hypothetical protein